MNIVLVAIGGALGAMARYLLGLIFMKRFEDSPFPVAMLIVNIIGSLGLGMFFGLVFGRIPGNVYHDPLFLLMGIGFFGAFTTFSTFSVETVELVRNQDFKNAGIYVGYSLLGSLLSIGMGLWIGISIG